MEDSTGGEEKVYTEYELLCKESIFLVFILESYSIVV